MAWRVSQGLKIETWNTKLRKEAILGDIFTDLMGTYSFDKKSGGEASIINVKPRSAGAFSDTIPLINNLSDNGTFGRQSQMGREEDLEDRHLKIYGNSFSHAVPIEKYGIDAFESKAYGIIQEVQPRLSLWHKEKTGLHIRQALCERYSEQLRVAPTSLTPEVNSNVYICGLDAFNQPEYDANPATFATNIADALKTAPTTEADDNRLTQIKFLTELSFYASNQKIIDPVTMSGSKQMYTAIIPAYQMQLFMNPNNGNAMAGFAKDADVRGPNNRAFSQEVKTFGKLMLCSDDRAPMVSVNHTTKSLTFGYKGPGISDSRFARGTSAVSSGSYDENVTIWECGFLLGKGAVYNYEIEVPHFKEEIQDYGKIAGIGAFRTNGYQLGVFDQDTETTESRLNQTSILCLYKA
jgi:hypothetical protein